MRLHVLVASFAVAVASLTTTPAVAVTATGPAAPAVTVTPSTGLVGGDVVTVVATGLPADVTAHVVQCDSAAGAEYGCQHRKRVLADEDGRVSTALRLTDPVFRTHEYGSPTPVYCRADVCRIFVEWTVDHDKQQVSSSELVFVGSPATIAREPAGDLADKQLVQVLGTADGAAGQVIRVVEEACYDLIQGSGCQGVTVRKKTRVQADGSWSLQLRVSRNLVDGEDCADVDGFSTCMLVAKVLDSAGRRDNSFGVSRIGDPNTVLTFSTAD